MWGLYIAGCLSNEIRGLFPFDLSIRPLPAPRPPAPQPAVTNKNVCRPGLRGSVNL